jgi:hypothetical protein
MLKYASPSTMFHYCTVAFLKDDESHIDLEVSYALGGRVFNCPSC